MKMNIWKKACLALLATVAIPVCAQHVHISTNNTSLVLEATEGETLTFAYYGDKIGDSEIDNMLVAGTPKKDAYPAYGMQCIAETALSAVHVDGNMTLQLVVSGVRSTTESNGAKVTTIVLKDKVYPFIVNVNYRTYPNKEIIETWTEISHQEKGVVKLTQFASGYLPLRVGDVWVSHLYG